MNDSIWSKPLESLYEGLARPTPAPAAVTAAAVSARLGLALLIKALEVVGKRNSFAGDRIRLRELIDNARLEAAKLAEAADQDIAADDDSRRSEIPMKAARAADEGSRLCDEARAFVTGAILADLDAAEFLLDAAAQAIHACLRVNLQSD